MKLHDAVVMGRFCGLNSVEECVANVELHYFSLLPYSEVPHERNELYSELEDYEREELILDWDAINAEIERHDKEYEEWHKNTVSDPDEFLDFELELFH